ncbi:hypothetical protein ACMYYO_08250 [Dermacoccaceae bacterium W4C1]
MSDRLARHPLLIGGLGLLVAQLLLRWWLMKDGFFWQDDFRYLYRVSDGLSLDALFEQYNGHLMPGTFLLSWFVQATGSSWTVAVLLLLVLQVAAGLSSLWMLRTLFADRAWLLIAYAAILFTPLTFGGSMWFAYGLQLWPQQIALTAGLTCYVQWRRTGRQGWLVGFLVAFAAGLFFWEKALLLLPAVGLFAILVMGRQERLRDRVRVVLTREWPVWVGLAVASVLYLVLYRSATSEGGTAAQSSIGNESPLEILANGIFQTLMPGVLGGPWTGADAQYTSGAIPAVAVTALVAVIWVAYIGATVVLRGRQTLRVWWWIAAVLLINFLPTIAVRAEAGTLVRDARYVADVVPLVVVAVCAAALSPSVLSDQGPPARHRSGAGELVPDVPQDTVTLGGRPVPVVPVALLAAAALFAGGWASMAAVNDQFDHQWSRNYVRALQLASDADPDRPLLDRAAPFPQVYFGDTSQLAAGMNIETRWVSAGRGLSMVDPFGRVGPVDVPKPTLSRTGPRQGCGWLISPGEPLELPIGRGDLFAQSVLTLGYLNSKVVPLQVQLDGRTAVTTTTAGGLGRVTVTLTKPTQKLTVRAPQAGSTVCISEVKVGAPGLQTAS